MSTPRMTVLVVGATGSIGRLVVEEAVTQGHAVRALVRDPRSARRLMTGVELVVGDVTRPETLTAAVERVDAIVFTHGSGGGSKADTEQVDYGGVRNVLAALGGRQVRIALMTAIGVTNREGKYNRKRSPVTGNDAVSGSCASVDCRTRSCDPVGSTATSQTSIGSSSCRAIVAMRVIPATGSSPAVSSLKCWSPASLATTHGARRSSSSRRRDQRSPTFGRCSLRWRRSRRARWMGLVTSRICRCQRNRIGCDTTWRPRRGGRIEPSNRSIPHLLTVRGA